MDCNYLKRLLACIAEVMQENRENLIQLDSIVGDGDLGLTMSDGFKAASESIQNTDETDILKYLESGRSRKLNINLTAGRGVVPGILPGKLYLCTPAGKTCDGVLSGYGF